MKDVFSELRQAYSQQLNNLSVGSDTIPCYDTVKPEEETDTKFILLSTQTDSQEGNKHANIYDCTVLVDIVTVFGKATGRKPCDDIANAVLQEITTANLALTNFQLVTTERVSNESFYSYDGSQHIYRRLIRFRHSVVERTTL